MRTVRAVKIERRTLLGIINLAILAGILLAGLWPFNFWPVNQVDWLKDQNGLHFHGRGVAFTKAPLSTPPQPVPSIPHPLSLEIYLEAGKESFNYAARVLSLYDGKGVEKIILSQWKSGLIVQKDIGDLPEETYPKIGLREVLPKGVKRLITITSGPEGTCIYKDGRFAVKHSKFHLFPGGGDGILGQLILGNAPEGKQPWDGNIYGLALYSLSLTGEQVFQHAKRWAENDERSLLTEEGLIAFYPFNERAGTQAGNLSTPHSLQIPPGFQILRKTVLSPPWKDFRYRRSYITDVMTNILGFIPLGFFLSALMGRTRHPVFRRTLLCLLLAAGISLSIELLQVYLPTRSSQWTDVICNTLGASIGIYLQVRWKEN